MGMLWFSNDSASPTQFVGIDCGRQDDAYVLTLVHPDGSLETKTFDDEDAMFEGALKIHCGLDMRGWRLCLGPSTLNSTPS